MEQTITTLAAGVNNNKAVAAAMITSRTQSANTADTNSDSRDDKARKAKEDT